jgi:hypothetical protein
VIIIQFSLDLQVDFGRKIIISELLEGQHPGFKVAFSTYHTVCFVNFRGLLRLLYIIHNESLPFQKEF